MPFFFFFFFSCFPDRDPFFSPVFFSLPIVITKPEFDEWVARHRELDAEGLGPVAEDNRALTGTYLMLDALARFFHNRSGEHVYTESLLEVGEDLEALGVSDGDPVELTTAVGSLTLPAEAKPGVARGVVVVPHGLPTLNVNELIPAGVDAVEALSGMTRMTGIPVQVRAPVSALA